ncbi:MAG: gamma-glutamyltransferase family protein [Synechococcaceae cyanobacterium]|nr:gamma-glutamyltransferase family protein [Synechococcaceae cyanobacterium]
MLLGRGAALLLMLQAVPSAHPAAAQGWQERPGSGAAGLDLPPPAGRRSLNVLQESSQRFMPQWSPAGIVASQEVQASRAGAMVLGLGGNAVDAAVATAFALAVTLPQAGNLGGGGFLVLWLPGESPARSRGCLTANQIPGDGPELSLGRGYATAVNFRETAPAAATATLFQRPDGRVDRERSRRGLQSTAVPGTVAGLLLAQRCYGRLPLGQVIRPAIQLAEQGVRVDRELADSLAAALPLLASDPHSRRQFLRPVPIPSPSHAAPGASAVDLRALRPGEILRQPQLAATLRRIARFQEAGFYQGPVAAALSRLMAEGGGLIHGNDLRAYRALLVRPEVGRFRGHLLLSMPPPGGGMSLLQLLELLAPLDLGEAAAATSLHQLVEAMNLVFRDRNRWLGDPLTLTRPIPPLRDPIYLEQLRRSLDRQRHRPSASLNAPEPLRRESTNTTHLSVADRRGGLVALTTTLNFAYGNGITVPGAGFLLNNEMDDFSVSPGSANAFGLIQGEANRIGPGRRPLSSMAPTLVFRPDGSPWLATGSPGGSRILTTVAQVLLHRIVWGANLATAVAAPRLHSQLWPDQLALEEGFSPDSRVLLQAMGHTLVTSPAMGAANSVEVLTPIGSGSVAATDPRRGQGGAVAEAW